MLLALFDVLAVDVLGMGGIRYVSANHGTADGSKKLPLSLPISTTDWPEPETCFSDLYGCRLPHRLG